MRVIATAPEIVNVVNIGPFIFMAPHFTGMQHCTITDTVLRRAVLGEAFVTMIGEYPMIKMKVAHKQLTLKCKVQKQDHDIILGMQALYHLGFKHTIGPTEVTHTSRITRDELNNLFERPPRGSSPNRGLDTLFGFNPPNNRRPDTLFGSNQPNNRRFGDSFATNRRTTIPRRMDPRSGPEPTNPVSHSYFDYVDDSTIPPSTVRVLDMRTNVPQDNPTLDNHEEESRTPPPQYEDIAEENRETSEL